MTEPNDFVELAYLLAAIEEAQATGPARWHRTRTDDRQPLCALLRWLVWHRDGGRCHHCGTSNRPTEIDHVIPWSAGGPDAATNLRVLCAPCNQARSNLLTLEGPELRRLLPVTPRCDDCLTGPSEWDRMENPAPHPPKMSSRQDEMVHRHHCDLCRPTWLGPSWAIGIEPATLAFCGHCMTITNVTNPDRLL